MLHFTTEHLSIRDHKESDFAALKRLLTDRIAMRYLPEIQCETDADVCANLAIALQEAANPERTKYFFAIETEEALDYVGEIGFTIERQGMAGGIANLGYFILPAYWRRGYVTEAARATIDFVFRQLPLHKVTSGCLKENAASERVMIKCGMIKEADYAAHILHEQRWKDRVEYRLLREEWEKRGSRRAAIGDTR